MQGSVKYGDIDVACLLLNLVLWFSLDNGNLLAFNSGYRQTILLINETPTVRREITFTYVTGESLYYLSLLLTTTNFT